MKGAIILSETKYFKSVKTNEVAELVGKSKNGVVLLLSNGEERVLALSTLKRWWVGVDETAPSKPPRKPVRRVSKSKKLEVTEEDVANLEGTHKQFVTAILKLTQTVGSEMFIRETTGSYNLTTDGTIYLLFKLTKAGVNVFVKSKAVGTGFEHTTVNHNFDMRVTFSEWNTKCYNTLRQLHDLSLQYQTNKKKK